DELTLAFLDIMPVNKGHALVIPKGHYETLLDIPEKELDAWIKTIQKVSGAVMKGTDAQGFNLGMNNFKVSGQLVPHAHMHIIPRFEDDGLKHWGQGNYEQEEMKEFEKKIKEFLK
ncbi:MAG: HIT family protein, partial [Candidatus Diapherotrites archaeon]